MDGVSHATKNALPDRFHHSIESKLIKSILMSAIIFVVTLSLFLTSYVSYNYYDINGLYKHTKSPRRGWTGNPLVGDPRLGLKPRPAARGAEIYPVGPAVPARFSHDGFRIPAGPPEAGVIKRPLFLSLGGSFTYGSSCLAEETYTYLVARHFQGHGLNAGVPSYGLAQIHLLAAELIPKYKPDYVIVQYSPWLVDRATAGYLPSYFGRLPSPYFFIDAAGEVAMHSAYYQTAIFSFEFDPFRRSRPGWLDKFRFFTCIGLPLSLHDDFNEIYVHLKKRLSLLPEPIQNRSKLLLYVYKNLSKVCADNQAKLYILALDSIDLNDVISRPEKELLAGLDGAVMIDTTPELRRRMSPSHDSVEQYGHWRNGSLVDAHPNAAAQAIYAEALINQIAGPIPESQ